MAKDERVKALKTRDAVAMNGTLETWFSQDRYEIAFSNGVFNIRARATGDTVQTHVSNCVFWKMADVEVIK